MALVTLESGVLTLAGDPGVPTAFVVRKNAADPTKVEAFAGDATGQFLISAVTSVSITGYEPTDTINYDEALWSLWPITLSGNFGKLAPSQITPDTQPPAPPSNLSVTAVSTGVMVRWDPNTEPDLAGYHVYASDTDPDADASAAFSKLNTAVLVAPNHFDSTIETGVGARRWYRVYAVDVSGNFSDPSQIMAGGGADTEPPHPPTGLAAAVVGNNINLSWSLDLHARDIAGHRVTRALADVNGTYHALASVVHPTSSYSDTTAPANVDCFYGVAAYDRSGNESTPATATAKRIIVDAVAPAQPTGFLAADSAGGIALSWNASPESDLAGYNLYRLGGSGEIKLNTALLTGLTALDADAVVGATNHYRLSAVDTSANESTRAAASATRAGAPPPPPPPPAPVETGWTDFPLRPTARKIYVSSSLGRDTNNGLAENAPLKTIRAGYALLRDGRGDQLLLKRGDTFTDPPLLWRASGFDATYPVLLSAYGSETLERPLWRLRPAANAGGILVTRECRHIAFAHVELYCPGRNPADADFDNRSDGGYGIRIHRKVTGFRLEGCRISWYSYNFAHDLADDGEDDDLNPDGVRSTGIKFRRNVLADAWARETFRGQGIYAADVADARFEQNYWIHNGWNDAITGATRTMFRHNCYLGPYEQDNGPMTFVEDVFIDGGNFNCQCRPGGTIHNCLLIRGSYNANLFGATGTFSFNCVYDSQPLITGSQSVGVEIGAVNSTVRNNLFFRPAGGVHVNGHGAVLLNLRDKRAWTPAGDLVSVIKDNVMFRWNSDGVGVSTFWHDLTITGNKMVGCTGKPVNVRSGVRKSQISGNLTSATFPNSGVVPPADLATTARAQRKGNWNESLTAAAINASLRAGFGMGEPV